MSDLEAVLANTESNLHAAYERLFALLRIRAISADPAYAEECRADWHARGSNNNALTQQSHLLLVEENGGLEIDEARQPKDLGREYLRFKDLVSSCGLSDHGSE